MDLEKLFVESKQELRKIEKILRRSHHRSLTMGLRESLISKLPSYLVPSNIGGYNKVAWPFFHVVNFNFGVDPVYGPATRQQQSFRVTQEAAFLLQGIYRKSDSYTAAGELAPLQLKIVDRQSTRQFNDNPVRFQNIGKLSRPTIFPTPMLIMPSAIIELEMSCWFPEDVETTGLGSFDFAFFGYRVRVEDADRVLSSVFAR